MRNNNNNNSAITWRPVTSESCDCSIAPPFVAEKASTFFFTFIREFTLKRTKSGQPASLCCCSAAAQPRWFTKRTLVGAAASVRRHRPRRLREIVDADFDGRRVVCTIEIRAAGVFHAALASIVCVHRGEEEVRQVERRRKKSETEFQTSDSISSANKTKRWNAEPSFHRRTAGTFQTRAAGDTASSPRG